MSNNQEEKFDPLPVEEDDARSRFSVTRGDPDARARLWHDISIRTYSYMIRSNVNNDWFRTRLFYNHPDHARHGFELRIIDMNETFDTERDRYRNEQWNRFMDRTNNVFAHVLFKRENHPDATDEEIKELSVDRMKRTILRALNILFDAHHPDRGSLRECLSAPVRNDVRQSIAHATFSMRGNKHTNVCWKVGSEYDCLLAHFFRAILFHYLSFMKEYTTVQKYYVKHNLTLQTFRDEITGFWYRKVVFQFSLGAHPLDRADNSDDEIPEEYLHQGSGSEDEKEEKEEKEEKDERDEEQVERFRRRFFNTTSFSSDEQEEEENEERTAEEEDSTLVVTLRADGSSTLHQPLHYRRITQIVEAGRIIAESEQLGALVHHLMPLLNLSQLEVLAARATSHVNVLRERAAERERIDTWARNRPTLKRKQTAVRGNCSSSAPTFKFRTTMSFSSESEGNEGDEGEEEEDDK
jgi:hypothetical protein